MASRGAALYATMDLSGTACLGGIQRLPDRCCWHWPAWLAGEGEEVPPGWWERVAPPDWRRKALLSG